MSQEELTYKIGHEFYEEGQIIFKTNDDVDKVYILADGAIDIYLSLSDEDLILDSMTVPGCVLCQLTILVPSPITYSARAAEETNLLVLERSDLEEMCTKLRDLDSAINKTREDIKADGMPMLDYQIQRRASTNSALL